MSIQYYVVYAPDSGEIVRHGMCARGDLGLQPQPGESVLAVDRECRTDRYYVVDGAICDRPSLGIVQSRDLVRVGDVVVFEPIPRGAVVRYADQTLAFTGSVLEWSSAVSGVFDFRFSLFPYQSAELTVTVVEQ